MLSPPGEHWQRRQPGLIDVNVDRVVFAASVIGPQVLLAKTNPIQLLLRKPVKAMAEFFRIGELAACALDHPLLASDIERRATMAGRVGQYDLHTIAGCEPWRHRPFSAICAAICAMRSSSSLSSMMPFSTSSRRVASMPRSK